MKLIVGLGNPGRRYRRTRHNVGWDVLDVLAHRHQLSFQEEGWSEVTGLSLDGRRALLARPQTYMNSSGVAVADLRRRHRIASSNLLIIFDDLDLPLGRIRLRAQGGPGGHNGMRSIIDALGTREFPRLRIGVGRPAGVDPTEFVLQPFEPAERPLVERAVTRAADAVEMFVRAGIEPAMNAFNLPETVA